MGKINVNLALIDTEKVEKWRACARSKKPRPWPLNAWLEVAADAMADAETPDREASA